MVTSGSKKQVGARISADLYKQLKVLAAQNGAFVGDLVERAIRDFLKQKGKRPK